MKKLKAGDRVAIVSPSWGGPGEFPKRYMAGKMELEERFGVEVVAMPNALKPAGWLAENPGARADDINQAFADKTVKAIISSIGGDDAIRIVPYLDRKTIRANPKPFMGYSDTTVIHLFLYQLGVHSFYGPALMAGFAEGGGMLPFTEHYVRRAWFDDSNCGPIPTCDTEWISEAPDFNDPYSLPRTRLKPTHRMPLSGKLPINGHLLGGCMEVLEFCRGTSLWPTRDQWRNAALFLEIADAEKFVPVERLIWFLRSLATEGVLQDLNAMIFAKPGMVTNIPGFQRYDKAIQQVLKEYGREDLVVLTRMEFGHSDPMFVIPYGVNAEVCPATSKVTILEDRLSPA